MQHGVISPQVEPEAYVVPGQAPWGYVMQQPFHQPAAPHSHGTAPAQQQLSEIYAAMQQQAWPLITETPAAYLQVPMEAPAPAIAPVHPALMSRGGLTRSHSRRDGVFTLAVTLVVLMIALAGAVALEGGLVRHDTPAPSSPAPTAAVAAPAAAVGAAPAPTPTAAPAAG